MHRLSEQLATGQRLTESQALDLFRSREIHALGELADAANQRRNGQQASYILNRYINYSNYCVLSCQFCAFARKKRDSDGFEHSVAEVVEKAREALSVGVTELHIVGGLHPSLPFSYYLDMLKALRGVDSRLQLKCFTAIEIRHLAWISKRQAILKDVLSKVTLLSGNTDDSDGFRVKELRKSTEIFHYLFFLRLSFLAFSFHPWRFLP